MRYPMILPWLARKAGVPVPAAWRIWDRVIADSDRKFGPNVRGSAYWGHVLAEFRHRLRLDSGRRPARPIAAADAGSLLWIQARLVGEAMAAWAGFLRGACSAWARLLLAWPRVP
jgi:hypothetical protein